MQKRCRQRSDAAGGETRRAGQGEAGAGGWNRTRVESLKASALPLSYARAAMNGEVSCQAICLEFELNLILLAEIQKLIKKYS